MKTLSLKIAVSVVLILAVSVLVWVFWPTETKHTVELTVPIETTAEKINPRAEELYQTALNQKDASYSAARKYRIMTQSCRYIIERFPNSPQAEKARELLQEVPPRYQKRYARSTTFLPVQSEPKVRKSKPLRRRRPQQFYEPYDINFMGKRPPN